MRRPHWFASARALPPELPAPEQAVRSQLARLAMFASVFFVLCSVLFIVNQTAQAVALASTVSPLLGKIVLVGLLTAFGIITLVPLVMIARLPTAISPPAEETSSHHETYLRQLGARLEKNPHLLGSNLQLSDRVGIEAALRMLDAHVNGIIKKTASTTLLSTAISQNGRLDALMVLASQAQMVWQIARVYNQRPSLRDMVRLYSNVGATVFLASQIEDLDITNQVEPVIKAAIGGSLAGLVPGITHISTIVMHSILEGTANAYLTLRVGIICRTYCSSLVSFDRKNARRNASVTAAAMLGAIVAESAGKVATAIFAAAKKAGAAGIRRAGERLNPFKNERD